MLPIEGVARPAGSPEPLRPDPLRPLADPLRPEADALPLETAGVLALGADALRASDEPPWSEGGRLRGDVGFIGWLGTRRLRESYPRGGRLGAFTGQKPLRLRA